MSDKEAADMTTAATDRRPWPGTEETAYAHDFRESAYEFGVTALTDEIIDLLRPMVGLDANVFKAYVKAREIQERIRRSHPVVRRG